MSLTTRSPARMRILAAATVAALLLGTASPHTGLAHHCALDGPTRVFLASDCSGAPAMEKARAVDLLQCAACAFLLQTLCAGVPLPQPLPGLIPVGLTPHIGIGAIDIGQHRLALLRGPPPV
ncbi:MAG TPA: hypothetical protein VMK12_27345 [Anaeromyxobacteraceae bacterium]|nr:hypothetical protein [Anaeromyxobacteraceae bacterium]